MKLGLSAWSLQGRLFSKELDLSGFLAFARSLDVDGVELLDCFWEDEGHPERIRQQLREMGMPVSAYAISNDFLKSPETLAEEQQKVRAGIDLAVFLGTPLLRVFCGDLREGVTFDAGKDRIIQAFRELAPYAEEKGITMVLENHGRVAGRSEQVKSILDGVRSSHLMANTDTGNFLLACEDPLEAVRALREQVGYVHYKDFKRVDAGFRYTDMEGRGHIGIPLGEGEVPLEAITTLLRESGYQGYLSIEYEGEGIPEEDVRACVQYARRILSA